MSGDSKRGRGICRASRDSFFLHARGMAGMSGVARRTKAEGARSINYCVYTVSSRENRPGQPENWA